MPELNNIFFTKETINRIYQRRSYLTQGYFSHAKTKKIPGYCPAA